jgi:hypothetical protein
VRTTTASQVASMLHPILVHAGNVALPRRSGKRSDGIHCRLVLLILDWDIVEMVLGSWADQRVLPETLPRLLAVGREEQRRRLMFEPR